MENNMADRTYQLTDEQFQQLLAATKPAQPSGGAAQTPDEQVGALLDHMRGADRETHTIEEIACTSTETGATFTAVVAKSKAFPAGRVLSIKDDYQYPDGADKPRLEGGLVPDGLTITRKDGTLSKEYKQWRWQTFWQVDLLRYVGKDAAWLRRMADIARASEEPATV